jgi:hypothetical protein
LSKKYNKLWVFGDSHTAPGTSHVNPADSFWGLLAHFANIQTIKNCSRPANSFDSVCHLLISLSNDIDWINDLIIIGVPPLERITVFDDYKGTKYTGYDIDTHSWQTTPFDISYHQGLISLQAYAQDKQLILHQNRSWLETKTLQEIFLLTKWLDAVSANYMIVNLCKALDKDNSWGPSGFVLPYCINHPRCILFKNTYYDINLDINKPEDYSKWGWYGHHGPAGHKYFFEESLLPTMKECKLVC